MTLLAKRASSRSERIVRSMCGGFLGVARRWNGGDPGVMATTIGPMMTTPYCSELEGRETPRERERERENSERKP